MSVEVIYLKGNVVPLYHHYSRQTNPQDAYIELDLSTGELSADWNGEIGNAVPEDVYFGHVRRFFIPCHLHRDTINKLLDEIKPFAEIAVNGYERIYDGNNGYIPNLTEEAEDALDAIDKICDDAIFEEQVPVFPTVDSWLNDSDVDIEYMIKNGKSAEEIAEHFWHVDEDGMDADGAYFDFDESDIIDYIEKKYAERLEKYQRSLDDETEDDEEIEIED